LLDAIDGACRPDAWMLEGDSVLAALLVDHPDDEATDAIHEAHLDEGL
jgi:hypothetical protein